MVGVNRVIILGRLGRDPEVMYTQAGKPVTKISVATSEKWTDKQTGERNESTEWHRIVFFGKQAETIGKYMQKGSGVYVEGKLQTSQYEKDGIVRYFTEIVATSFQFVGGRNERNNGSYQQGNYQNNGQNHGNNPSIHGNQHQGYQQQQQGGVAAGAQPGPGPVDDDVPF